MIGLISLNYKIAPVQIRELFYLYPDQYLNIYKSLISKSKIKGLFIISTCNRTEIYFETSSSESSSKSFHSVIMTLSKLKKFNDGLRPYIKKKDGVNAISKHLFRLASGLESMIVGEYQIVDQIKSAYKVCKTNKMLSPTLERMIQKSLEASKYIRTNSEIDKGGISVSSAAIDQLGNVSNSKNLSILCVGAGRTSKLSIKQLVSKKFKNIFITNRTESNVTPILEKFNLKLVKFNLWKKMLNSVDIIIFSTSSKKPLLSDIDLKNIDKQRKNKIVLVDLSVPRNIVIKKTYKNVELVDLDNLKDRVNENYNKRISEINKAELMIEDFINDFTGWVNKRGLRPTIISIKKEIKNLISDSSVKNDENKQIEEIYDKLSDKLVKKIISVSDNGKNTDALKIINKIFVSNE
jgi:glutamyl-tRNA reductase